MQRVACVCMSWAQETVSQCNLQHSNGLAKWKMFKAHKHVSIACGSTSNATTTAQRPFSIKIWLQTALRSPRERLSYAKYDCGAHVACVKIKSLPWCSWGILVAHRPLTDISIPGIDCKSLQERNLHLRFLSGGHKTWVSPRCSQ